MYHVTNVKWDNKKENGKDLVRELEWSDGRRNSLEKEVEDKKGEYAYLNIVMYDWN